MILFDFFLLVLIWGGLISSLVMSLLCTYDPRPTNRRFGIYVLAGGPIVWLLAFIFWLIFRQTKQWDDQA